MIILTRSLHTQFVGTKSAGTTFQTNPGTGQSTKGPTKGKGNGSSIPMLRGTISGLSAINAAGLGPNSAAGLLEFLIRQGTGERETDGSILNTETLSLRVLDASSNADTASSGSSIGSRLSQLLRCPVGKRLEVLNTSHNELRERGSEHIVNTLDVHDHLAVSQRLTHQVGTSHARPHIIKPLCFHAHRGVSIYRPSTCHSTFWALLEQKDLRTTCVQIAC